MQLLTLVIYLSNLKLDPKIRPTAALDSLESSSLILDNQEVLPPPSLHRRTTFSPSRCSRASRSRRATAWPSRASRSCGRGSARTTWISPRRRRTIFSTCWWSSPPSSDSSPPLPPSHRNLRFVSSAALLSFLRGLASLERSREEAQSLGRRKKSLSQQLASLQTLREQLYTSVICHRVRDVFAPIRLLVIHFLGTCFLSI